MQKIKVYHFHNGSGGGVLSVIRNLLKYSVNKDIENHIIYTINRDLSPAFKYEEIYGAASQQIFYYSPKWNFYYTCRQVAKLLPGREALVVAHDWLELGMISNLGLQNPVVQFVHGNYSYYYDLAQRHCESTERFIAISPVIHTRLCNIMPDRVSNIHYCRFPVPEIKLLEKKNTPLKILYCVRSLDDENKQFKLLPLINKKLKSKNTHVHWTIIGEGLTEESICSVMVQDENISYFSFLPNEKVLRLLEEHDLFLLPSLQEGFPVALVEGMKAGCVALVSDWEGATEELVIQNETGYYFKTGDVDGYADTIVQLNTDRKLLKQLAQNGAEKANELFNPFVNTEKIERLFNETSVSTRRIKKPFKAYGSRLDSRRIPNFVTYFIRILAK